MKNDRVSRFLVELGTPEPPSDLRPRALAAAEREWAQPTSPDPWRRVWESRPLRLAWAAAALALVAANLTLSGAGASRDARLTATTRSIPSPELQETVALPRLRFENVVDVAGGAPVRPQSPRPGPSIKDKETPS